MDGDELQAIMRRNIRVLMALHGIDTARDLAKLMGHSENQVSRQLRGTRAWQLSDLPALAKALKTTMATLLDADAFHAPANPKTAAENLARVLRAGGDYVAALNSWRGRLGDSVDIAEISRHAHELADLPTERDIRGAAERNRPDAAG